LREESGVTGARAHPTGDVSCKCSLCRDFQPLEKYLGAVEDVRAVDVRENEGDRTSAGGLLLDLDDKVVIRIRQDYGHCSYQAN
jgi:hypothetical protein